MLGDFDEKHNSTLQAMSKNKRLNLPDGRRANIALWVRFLRLWASTASLSDELPTSTFQVDSMIFIPRITLRSICLLPTRPVFWFESIILQSRPLVAPFSVLIGLTRFTLMF